MTKVKEFWDNQAQELGGAAEATSPDKFYRDYEIKRILEWIPEESGVLDIGCGNGYSTCLFAQLRPTSNFIGLDYSKEMIAEARKAANKRALPNVVFKVHDIKAPIIGLSPDIIVSQRCLINLASWDEQQSAINKLWHLLSKRGRMILVENTIEGLMALNEQRVKFGLPAIKMRWHNQYFEQDMLEALLDSKFRILHMENIGNLYYLISRVVYAKMAQMEGEEPQYDHIINKIAAQLPPVDGPYSPNMLWVLEKT